MAQTTATGNIQETLLNQYIGPARRRGATRVRVVAGDLVREMGLWKRVPQVCAAMQTKKFLRQNGLDIEKLEGPPSGQSTTVAVTYRLEPQKEKHDLFDRLRGIMREAYAREGGSEAFLRRERASFNRGRRP